MQPSAIDDLAEKLSNIVVRKIDVSQSGYSRGAMPQAQAQPSYLPAGQNQGLDPAWNTNQPDLSSYYNQPPRREPLT